MVDRTVTFCAYDKQGTVGGPIEWAGDFVAFLHSHGWLVRALVICRGGRPSSKLAHRLDDIGVENHVLDGALCENLESETEWILSAWKHAPTTYFIANLVLPALYAARWIKAAGGVTVGVIHSDPKYDSFYADVLRTFVGGPPELRMDSIVAVSHAIANDVRSQAIGATKVATIPCGTRATSARATKPMGCLRLIYAGRLVQPQKRIRDVVDALLVASRKFGVEASICGDGEERAWVEAALADQSAVHYLGVIPAAEIAEVFADHHVVVLLSDFEGLPISVVSAMACGLVPVCLDERSGVSEIIQHGVNGLIVSDRGDSFLRAVDSLRSVQYWESLSRNALNSALTRYSHKAVMPRWIEFLESMQSARQLSVDSIPDRVRLQHYRPPGLFQTYPPLRSSRLMVVRARLYRALRVFGTKIRPRARLRHAIESARARL